MNTITPHISIIIVHYNNEKQTFDCLDSLLSVKTDGFRFTTLIIDNGSQKKLQLSEKYSDRRFEVIRSETNLGFSGGNNLGIQYAIEQFNSDFLLLLNNDTIVEPNFLKLLYKTYKEEPNAGIICPLIYFKAGNEYHKSYKKNDEGKIIWFGGGSLDWNHITAFHRGVDEIDKGQFPEIENMDFATGCCMFIDREVLEKAGAFDERYFLYLEDVDLSLRVKACGYSLLLSPKAIIWHENAGSSGGAGSATQDYYMTRNRILLGLVHGDMRQKLTTMRIAWQMLFKGNNFQKKALFHVFTGQLGKQPLV